MMLRTGDLNLNQFGDSMKEAVKRTMLQHEFVFKNQVRDLHRLYWTQKNLMRELHPRELESRVVGSVKEGNVVSLEEVKGKFVDVSENRHRSFNLELPADAYIGNSAKISVGGEQVIGSDSGQRVHSGSGGSECSVAGLADVSTDSTPKREPNSSKPMLIDLNIPQDDESSHALNDPMQICSSPSSSSSFVQNELLWRDQGNRYLKVTSASLNSEAPYSASRKSTNWLHPGCEDSQRFKVSDFGMKQQNEVGSKVQESNSTGLTECCRKSVEGFSSGSNGEFPNNAQGTDLSTKDFNVPVEENDNLSSAKLHSVSHSARRQASIVMADNITGEKKANHARSEEDTVSSHALARDEKQQDGFDEKLLTGSKSDVITGSTECSSLEKIMDENSGTTQSDNMVVESSLEQSCNIQQQHDQDHSVVDAAEILAGISLTQPSSPLEQFDGGGMTDIAADEEEKYQPQYSSDTFEAMTLELPEVRSDEQLMPTRQIEGGAGDSASGVNKIRRGRGRVVRDFQKDILPGMVSLSRHEICEDMHSIGYELRKNRSRRASGNWFVPVRSRRSRRYPVGRRN